MSEMDELVRAFDHDMRRRTPDDQPGVRVEIEPTVRRWIGLDDAGWFAVDWSALDASNADAAIAREIEIFAALDRPFEWKYYDYDTPADLERRLLAAGFVPDDDESVMIGVLDSLPRSDPPQGVRIERVADEAGVEMLLEINRIAFGRDQPRYRETLLAHLERDDGRNVMVLARAGDEPVSAARLEMPPGSRFASLWGGGTVPSWRGRGIYRALVSWRAGIAAERGYRYLHVDASSESRPILERLGFVRIARTTPYLWSPR